MCVYSIEEITEKIYPIAKEYNISEIYIFGSYARNEATEESDVDFYIPKLPSNLGIKYFGMYEKIKSTLDKEIDIITDKTTFLTTELKNKYIYNINQNKVKIYG